jgi:hypothetical protein
MLFSPLPVHISAGVVGILSGAAALSFRKGSPRHALAGKIFVIAMMTMASSALYLAFRKHQMVNVLGGTFAFYLVTTAWLTAKRRDGETSLFDWGAPGSFVCRYRPLDLWFTSSASPGEVHRWSSRWDALFHGFCDAAGSRWGHSHARARRRLRSKAHRAPSLAHVLWPFRRHRILFPGTATGLPRLVTPNKRTVCPCSAAARFADVLAVSRLVHHCLPEKGSRGSTGSVLMSCKYPGLAWQPLLLGAETTSGLPGSGAESAGLAAKSLFESLPRPFSPARRTQ